MNGERYIEPYRFWCQKILPLTYDDSLSYYETLCKISEKLNEVIDQVNSYRNEYKGYVDEEILKLKGYVDTNDDALRQLIELEVEKLRIEHIKDINTLNEKLEEKLLEVNLLMEKYKNDLNHLKSYFIADQLRQDQDIDRKLTNFYKEIYELIKQTNSLVQNPVTGAMTTVQQALNDLYNSLRYDAFTCAEFDATNETCEYWDGLEFTAIEFDMYGGQKYGKRVCECYMFNPYTGSKDKITNVISMVITNTAQGVTAIIFDSKDLTAEGYDAKEITAENFDFKGQIYL